jgi:hypothetical protein
VRSGEKVRARQRPASRHSWRARIWLVAAVLLTLAVAACGSSPAPSATPEDLFHAYLESTNVKNDEFSGSPSSADRIANFAAHGTPSDIESYLFSASQCDMTSGGETSGGFTGQHGCPPNASVADATGNFTGSGGKFYERNILVKHQSGQLELITLYVAANSAGATELIDTNGRTYTGGLADFRQNNELLTADDQVLAPTDITATSGGGQMVVVSGHTSGSNPWPFIGIGFVVLVAVGGGVIALIRARRTRPLGDQDGAGFGDRPPLSS